MDGLAVTFTDGLACCGLHLLPLERVDVKVEADFGLLLGGHGVEAEPLERLQLPLVVVDLAVVQVHVGRRGEHAFCWAENRYKIGSQRGSIHMAKKPLEKPLENQLDISYTGKSPKIARKIESVIPNVYW